VLLVLSRVSKARPSQPGEDVTFIVTLNLNMSRDSLSSVFRKIVLDVSIKGIKWMVFVYT
jgi:hypothetical protein